MLGASYKVHHCWFSFSRAAFVWVAVLSPWFAAHSQPAEKPLVVVITIDGFPARALNDPRLPMPHLRALIHGGVSSEGMVPINPTVTWPNHTALISGVNASEHHVMANGLISFPADGGAPQVKPWVDKDELVHARTLYDAAADKGLITGQVNWVAIYGAKHVQWSFGEKPDPSSAIAQDLVADGILTAEQVEHFGDATPAWHDEIWTDAAVDILERHTPNLLLLHLLETDSLQHTYGPLTPAAYAAYGYADDCIGRVLEAVKQAGALSRTTFFILSDHGFSSYTHVIRPNVLLRDDGLVHGTGKEVNGTAWALAEGGAAEVFVRDLRGRAERVAELKKQFAALPGVQDVFTGLQMQALGLPLAGSTDQAPDLYMTAAPGYAFDGANEGPMSSDIQPAHGAHGYANSNPEMQALFVASGARIQSGIRLPVFSNLRVAPTIARVLGVNLPDAKEQPLAIMR
jgi:predicted AlkP superfamily pyrophosphatase or phosphodiesterase